jgi:hydroxymethylbilane synthase
MTRLRVGTRGSDLALWQTNWVCERLRAAHPELELERIIIKTHGDVVTDRNFGRDWPVGAFVSALENALLEDRVDFAVHSFKDLQTAETAGLTIAATPPREVVHDVLLTGAPLSLDALPTGARIGTNSPRRAAQLREFGDVEIVPIRGNVPTRIAKIEREDLHGVVLAAAGLKRLAIEHPHRIDLPTQRFVPAPAQGALAVQTRAGDPAEAICAALDDAATRRAVVAERTILSRINAGCHTPVGALATVQDDEIRLHAKLFSDDYAAKAEDVETGRDPIEVGTCLAERLLAMLRERA